MIFSASRFGRGNQLKNYSFGSATFCSTNPFLDLWLYIRNHAADAFAELRVPIHQNPFWFQEIPDLLRSPILSDFVAVDFATHRLTPRLNLPDYYKPPFGGKGEHVAYDPEAMFP